MSKNSRKLLDTAKGCSFKHRKSVLTERQELKTQPWDLEDLGELGAHYKGERHVSSAADYGYWFEFF